MARRATQYALLRQRRCVGHWSSSQLVAVVFGSFDQPSNSKNHATTIHSETLDGVSYGIALYFQGSVSWNHRSLAEARDPTSTPYSYGTQVPRGIHMAGLYLMMLMTTAAFRVSLEWPIQLLRNRSMTGWRT